MKNKYKNAWEQHEKRTRHDMWRTVGKQETENNTEPKRVNRPVKMGYTAFRSLLQWFVLG